MLRSGEPALILVTGRALREDGLALAGRIAAKTGARIIAQGSNARTQRGRGRVSVDRIPYVVDQALKVLAGLQARHPGRREDAGGVLRLSRQAEPADPGRLPGARAGAAGRGPDRGAGDAGRRGRGARHAGAGRQRAAARRRRPGAITSEALGAVDRRAVAGERDRRRRGGDDRARRFSRRPRVGQSA